MISQGIIGAIANMFFGSFETPKPDPEYDRLRLARAEAVGCGWIPWIYAEHGGASPYAYQKIWIWRPEWTGPPRLTERIEFGSEWLRTTNAVGLYWKPWRGSEPLASA